MDIQPQNNYVLVEIQPQKLFGGIVLTESREFAHLIVIAVGPGKLVDSGERIAPTVKPGDRVLVHELANKSGRVQAITPALVDGRKLLLVDAGDIIGTTTGEIKPPLKEILRAPAQKVAAN